MIQNDTLEAAYQHCLQIARSHYENFPVASWLLPSRLRRATAVIYSFARRGDDIADEGAVDTTVRHAALQVMWNALDDIAAQRPCTDPLFIALTDVIHNFKIPLQYCYDLLKAFRSDIDIHQYNSYTDVKHYCRHSADPVGRIVLHIHDQASPENLLLSDQICTALQLINFIQDVDSDWQERQRCYLPLDEMHAQGIELDDLTLHRNDLAMHSLIRQQLDRARQMLSSGAPLVHHLHGALAWEIRAIVASAWRISDKLAIRTNIYQRPTLRPSDAPSIFSLMMFYTRRICTATLIKSSA